jgi:hypothetical protein
MRVQLQQQDGGRTIHHGSVVLDVEQTGGVTVDRLKAALRRLRNIGVIPEREIRGADAALVRAERWIGARPPTGVSGRFGKSFYFAPQNPRHPWRFDIEGLRGEHLQR